MQFTFSDNIVTLLSQFEGLKLKPYLDSVGKPTIGYGSTIYPNGVAVTMSDKAITKDQAKEYLLDHLRQRVLPAINNGVKVNQNQNQVDALGSLIYNIGAGDATHGFLGSTLLKRINAQATLEEIKEAWLMWKNAGGKPILLARREKEFEFYSKIS